MRVPFPVEVITWDDSETSDGWQSQEVEPPEPCVSVGMVYHETTTQLHICHSWEPGGEINGALRIPRVCIISWRVLLEQGSRV